MKPDTKNFCLVTPQDVPGYWQQIEEAYETFSGLHEMFTIDSLRSMLQVGGGYNLWLAVDQNEIEGIAVTALLCYPTRRTVYVAGVAGKPGAFRKYIALACERVEQFGVVMGATSIVIDGRDGLNRVMKKHGYKTTTRMEKDIRAKWG